MATRYRCTACGNLTRFDVVTRQRTRAFHHYTVGGDLEVEDQEILDFEVEEVTCRWCGSGASVVTLGPDGDAPGSDDPVGAVGGGRTADPGTPAGP